MIPFGPGDVVRSEIAGPNMLVVWVREGEAMCVHIRNEDVVRQTFPVGTLTVVLGAGETL